MLCLRTEITISKYHCDHGLDLEFRTLSANFTKSAAWFWGYIPMVSTPTTLWNIGGVSIVDYTFAEVWLHECRVQR